jgi:hypothetical protein
MVFYVTLVTFLMTLFMNEFTNVVKNDWNLDDIYAYYWKKAWYLWQTFESA